MTYQLKKEKGGLRPERTYEFTAAAPAINMGTARRNSRSGSISADTRLRHPTAQKAPAASRDKLAEIENAAREAKARDRALLREEALIAEQEKNIRTVKAVERAPFPISALLASIICTFMFMYIIVNMVQINEESREIVKLRYKLSTLQTQVTELADKLEQKNDLRYIEEYAVNTLGMVKTDQLSKQYVSLAADDTIQLVTGEEEQTDSDSQLGLTGLGNKIKGKLSELWEYIS